VALGNGPILNCNQLWTALSGLDGSRPTDILSFYQGNPASGDRVTCSDAGGCAVTSANCFSSWDSVAQAPAGKTASIANGTYLACIFIDSPYADATPAAGAPPAPGLPAGLIAASPSTSFSVITLTNPTTTPLAFTSWVDY